MRAEQSQNGIPDRTPEHISAAPVSLLQPLTETISALHLDVSYQALCPRQ